MTKYKEKDGFLEVPKLSLLETGLPKQTKSIDSILINFYMKIGVCGITGKMGKTIATLVAQSEILDLAGGLVRKDSGYEDIDIGEFLGLNKSHTFTTADLNQFVLACDAIIDFSLPQLGLELAEKCAQNRKILVCGTTGFSESEQEKLASFGEKTVIVWSANMSLGVNLLSNLIEKAAATLHDDFDIEIVEMHHNKKIDAPSGTALLLGAAAAKGRGINLQEAGVMGRFGNDAKRKKGEIGFASLRGGDVVGDHKVIFAGNGERIELTHKAQNRDIFAKGAIRAAIWASGQKPGFYSMRNVLS